MTSGAQLLDKLHLELAQKNFSVPSLPEITDKIRRAIEKPNCDIIAISKMIAGDPPLSGRLIQAANSSLFKGLHHIDDIPSAISRLGLTCIKNLVLSLSVNSLFKSVQHGWAKKKLADISNSSIEIAAMSQVFAAQFKLDTAEALLAGLIHDIGAIPIITWCAENLGEPKDLSVIDEAIFKLSPHLSEWILQNWNLSNEIATVPMAISQLKREHEGRIDYADVVQVAKLHFYRGKKHPLGQTSWVDIPVFKRMNLSPEESIAALRNAHKEVNATMKLLKS